jgi:hypothetical protein
MIKTTRCEHCGKVLTDSESIARRVGPECLAKHQRQLACVAQARQAVAGGFRDAALKAALDRLYVAELCLRRAVEQGWTEDAREYIRKDIRTYRARIAARVERLAQAEAVAA